MAKITFETQMKGADVITRELEKLSKGLTDLGAAGAKVETQIDKTFKTLTDSISQVQKGQGGLTALIRSFTEVGHAINYNLGNAQVGLVRRLKSEISEAQKELKIFQSQAQDSSLSETDRSDAAIRADALQRQIQKMRLSAFMSDPIGMPFGGRFGAITPGGLIGAAGVAFGGYMAAAQGARYLNQLTVTDPIAARIAVREWQYGAGQQAMQGDITAAALERFGIGPEQDIIQGRRGFWGFAADKLSVGFSRRGLMGLLSGGSFTEAGKAQYDLAQQEMLMERREIARQEYEQLFNPATQIIKQRSQAVDLFERGFGLDASTNLMNQLAAGGISTQMAAPMVNLMARFGLSTAVPSFVSAYRRVGVGQIGMEQMTREAFLGGGTDQASQAAKMQLQTMLHQAGLGGVGNVAAREMLTDIVGQEAGRLGRAGRMEDVGRAYGAMTQNIMDQTGVPAIDAVRTAATVADSIKQLQESPTNLLGMMQRSVLSSLGINDPRAWAYFSKMGFQNQATKDQIIKQMELSKGRPLTAQERKDALDRVTGVYGEFNKARNEIFGGDSVIPEVNAFSLTGDITSANNVGDIDRAISAFGRGTGRAAGEFAEAKGGLDIQDQKLAQFESSAISAITKAFSATESQIARTVYDVIGKGFNQISEKMSELSGQFSESAAPGTRSFTGTRDQSIRKKFGKITE